MANRPLVTVQLNDKPVTLNLPDVFVSPIRLDIVQYVHTLMNKNHRQPYAVNSKAGMQHSAESWGTGRAVARIPRVSGGGTSRAGQGAFGNMCRKGRMFAPTKIWRRWHRKISKGQRRYATCSALAATAVPALVMARGHAVEKLAEVPLVVADAKINAVAKTKDAVKLLKELNAYDDIEKVKESRRLRRGVGKTRNRRYVQKRGPLVVHSKDASEDSKLVPAFRNIPGVEFCHVSRLNLLKLAPGGHLGRFIIWTESAFKQLNSIFGTYKTDSKQKSGFRPPVSILANPDVSRIVNNDAVQSVLRPKQNRPKFAPRKKNPLTNLGAMVKLNPHALTQKRRAILSQQAKKTVVKKSDKKDEKKKRVNNLLKKRAEYLKLLHAPAVAPVRAPEESAPTF